LKLWQKIFLLTLALVIIVVNVTSLALLSNNHRLAIEREQQNALSQHIYLITEMQNRLIYTQLTERTISLSDEEALAVVTKAIDTQRSDSSMRAALFRDNVAVYPLNQDFSANELTLLSEPDYSSSILEEDETTHLFIISTTTINGAPYKLMSSSDVSSTYDLFKKDFELVRVIGIVSALIVAGLLLLLVRGLLRPLRNLSGTTRKIASGDLDNRATVKGHDEVAEVARNLNTMADSIEQNVTELEALAESRRVFIGNLAHEMKTPLTSILGFADILRVKREVSDDDRIDYAGVIVSETKRLQGLSGKLMELLTLGNMQLSPELIEVYGLFIELSNILQPILNSHQIALMCEAPAEDLYIRADRELIKSLVFNLIDNSIKASKPETFVWLTADLEDKKIIITVRDEGVGIPEEQIPLLTEPFFMGDKARTRKHGGAGLGLALCSEIAQAHDSELVITSELGVGTSISFALAEVGAHG
jgi:signal transduction histidine kinase